MTLDEFKRLTELLHGNYLPIASDTVVVCESSNGFEIVRSLRYEQNMLIFSSKHNDNSHQ